MPHTCEGRFRHVSAVGSACKSWGVPWVSMLGAVQMREELVPSAYLADHLYNLSHSRAARKGQMDENDSFL